MKKSKEPIRLVRQRDKDSSVVIDNVAVLTVFAIVKAREFTLLDSEASQAVYKALIRSTNDLSEDSTPEEVADYLQGYDSEGLQGLTNNVKGITFEILETQAENLDGNNVYARLSEETNAEAVDAVYYSEETGEFTQIQFKATANDSLVKAFEDEHPNIQVIRADPDELAELTDQTEDTIEALGEGVEDTIDYIPTFVIVSSAIVAAPIVRDYWEENISKDEAIDRLVSSLGSHVGVSAAKLFLLATPAAPAVIGWSLWRIASCIVRRLSSRRGDVFVKA